MVASHNRSQDARMRVCSFIYKLVLEIEVQRRKASPELPPVDAQQVKQRVIDWEKQTFDACQGYTEAYKKAAREKRDLLAANLKKLEEQKLMSMSMEDIVVKIRTYTNDLKRVIQIIHTVSPKGDADNAKTTFLMLYDRVTKFLASSGNQGPQMRDDAAAILRSIDDIKEKIRPSVKAVEEYLSAPIGELIAMSDEPFSILKRAVELHGTRDFKKKAARISRHIGGAECLKQ